MLNIVNTRRADITVIRVLSMLMIVACHTIKFYTFIPGSQFVGLFFNVGVEIFLGMSGFLYGKKTITAFKPWIIKRIQRVCIPVGILSLIIFAILKIVFAVSVDCVTVTTYLFNLQGLLFVNGSFFGKWIKAVSSLDTLWFTTIIMICYLLVPYFQKLRSIQWTKVSREKQYMLMIVCLLIISFLLECTTGTALFYIVVFLAGYALSDLGYDEKEYSVKKVIVFIATVLILVTVRVVLRIFIDGTALYSSLVSIGHTIIGLSLMCLGLELYKKYRTAYNKLANTRVVQFFDGASFYIYLVHGTFCMGMTNVYDYFGVWLATVIFVTLSLLSAKLLWMITDFINLRVDRALTIKR